MEQKKTELSILIPVYNTVCVNFVRQLQQQVELTGIDYEIIVADDASSLQHCVEENRQIGKLPHCQYLMKEVNTGAAATRNFLAQQSRYQWLLFLDCDMQLPNEQFITRYLASLSAPVINGGLSIGGDTKLLCSNLRYRYEKAEEPNHTPQRRQQRPYQSFRSTNFLIRRDVMLNHPFDERFRRSGYEDVFFGKQLRQHQVAITHIDNPLYHVGIDTNKVYLEKTRQGVENLKILMEQYEDKEALVKGIRLLRYYHILIRCHVDFLFYGLFFVLKNPILWNLNGRHPNMALFNLYKLGYLCGLKYVKL